MNTTKPSIMKKIFLLLAMGFMLNSCGPQENPDPPTTKPTVTTGQIIGITATTATCSENNVTTDGGSAVTARGVCWSTSQNPTTSNSKTTNGSGMGTYTSNITGLSPKTTYYVRAYATNAEGTAYGEQKTLITLNDTPVDYGSFTDSRDGKVYKTVNIGDQVWMAENLAYLPSVVGADTGFENETDLYYYVYGYDGKDVAAAKATAYYQTYGVLYNWSAAMNGSQSSSSNPSGVQGACPPGWHLPSDAEWTQLKEYLIANGYNYDGTTEGDKIAISLASATGWHSSGNVGAIGNPNTVYDIFRNKSGFSALPGGYRTYTLFIFVRIGSTGHWWSSTQDDTNFAIPRNLHYFSSYVTEATFNKGSALSIRCVRDSD